MIGFLVRILGNSAAIYAAYFFVPGFIITGGIREYLLAGTVLGLLNKAIKPPIKLLTMPLIILTLGFFGLVINALLLWLVDYIFEFVTISGVYALILATIIIWLVNMIVAGFTKVID